MAHIPYPYTLSRNKLHSYNNKRGLYFAYPDFASISIWVKSFF